MEKAAQKVLLVEDEAGARQKHFRSLTDAQFEVRAVGDAAQAIKDLRTESFQLIIMEASMMDREGASLLDSLRALKVDAPVILLTSTPDNATTLRASELGALCLSKPIDAATLVTAVRQRIESLLTDPLPRSSKAAVDLSEAVTATLAKNEFGKVMDRAVQRGHVVITKHQSPRAVLLSYEEYLKLVEASTPDLESLTEEFDKLLARMQSPTHRAAARAFFSLSSKELGEAAVAAEDDA